MAITYTSPIGPVLINSATTGTTYTVAGSNGTTGAWLGNSTKFTSSNQNTVMSIPHGEEKVVIEKTATLDVQGTVKINGIDLEERLSTIEQVLQIPTRDVTMEAKYPKLAELYQQYTHELAKYKTWDLIKGNDDAT